MSFTIKTEKNEWFVSMGCVVGVPAVQASIWIAFNQDYDHVEADNLDHLMIAIDQFENPEANE